MLQSYWSLRKSADLNIWNYIKEKSVRAGFEENDLTSFLGKEVQIRSFYSLGVKWRQPFHIVSIRLFPPSFCQGGIIKVLVFLKFQNFANFLDGSQEYFGALNCIILGTCYTIPISYWYHIDIILIIMIKSYIFADSYTDIMLPKRNISSPNRT